MEGRHDRRETGPRTLYAARPVRQDRSPNDRTTSFRWTLRSIDQKALVFIDDKEVKQDTLKTMNPDLIESISVYKDSSAVVRYGERGKNGVILIKMKQ